MPVTKFEYEREMRTVGEIMVLSKTKIAYQTVYNRLKKGWDARDAVSVQPNAAGVSRGSPNDEYMKLGKEPRNMNL